MTFNKCVCPDPPAHDCGYRRVGVLSGHDEEISNCQFNFDCSLVASCSFDHTARLWDPRLMKSLAVITGHEEEVNIFHLRLFEII